LKRFTRLILPILKIILKSQFRQKLKNTEQNKLVDVEKKYIFAALNISQIYNKSVKNKQ
jgi:hypothetical protein